MMPGRIIWEDLESGWVYDIVYKRETDKIVALCYHLYDYSERVHPDCLADSECDLIAEGLTLEMSGVFPSLEEAKKYAWEHKDKFSSDLD
jgi:hypothetical protein